MLVNLKYPDEHLLQREDWFVCSYMTEPSFSLAVLIIPHVYNYSNRYLLKVVMSDPTNILDYLILYVQNIYKRNVGHPNSWFIKGTTASDTDSKNYIWKAGNHKKLPLLQSSVVITMKLHRYMVNKVLQLRTSSCHSRPLTFFRKGNFRTILLSEWSPLSPML